MMITLAVWLIAFTTAAGYGRLLVPRNSQGDSVESEFTRIYAGLLILSTILLAAALFTNLTPSVGLIAVLPGIILYWRRRDSKNLRYYYGLFALVALFVSLREINFYDTALYHQQAVKWLAQYGLVRGVALVYFRFGFVSSWFALAAPLDHGITAGRVGIIGGLPFVLAVAAGFHVARGILNRRPAATAWAILGLLLSVVAIVWHVDTSLSPDMMVWLVPLVIVTVIADPNATEADRLGRATLLSAMACLMKSTVAPVFGYCFVLLAWRFIRVEQDRRKLAGFAALALGMLALLIGANVIASGCPLFPSPLGCSSLGWSVGADAARSVQGEIEQFAHASRHNQIYPLTAAAALASVLLGATVRTGYARHILGITWVGIAFTFIVAPVPRYGLGYFLLPVAAVIAAALERIIVAPRRRIDGSKGWAWAPISLTATAAIAVLIFAATSRDWAALLYPRRIAAANGDPIHIVNRAIDLRGALAIREEKRGELTIWVPASSDQCWDAPLPCTPNLTRSSLALRDQGNLDGGFLTP
jgi:hypothetical protein